MFFGEFAENKQESIELKEIDYDVSELFEFIFGLNVINVQEFIELLNIVYSPSKKITGNLSLY